MKNTAEVKIIIPESNGIEQTPQSLIAMGIKQGINVEQLEKLMQLQERWEAKQARKKFLIAMSLFQANCPVIEKKKKVAFGNTKYSYADLSEISATLKETLANCGLTYRWEFTEGETFSCTCIISHIDGHSERSTMSANKDTSGNKNDIQARGSACTYLQRYSLVGALGLTTANEDTDGRTEVKQSVEPQRETTPQIKTEVKDEAPSEFLLELSALVDEKRELLTIPELKRAREIIKNKEHNSYAKLRTILKNK